MQRRRSAVCGTDFSACSARALEQAAALATHVTLVHVCQLGIDGDDEERLAACGQALAAEVARAARAGLDVSGVLRAGRPADKLDNVAAELGASLIVIGRHGAGRCAALGSVAEQLSRASRRDVLVAACALDCPETHPPRTEPQGPCAHQETNA